MRRPELPGALELGVAAGGDDRHRAEHDGELKREYRHAPRALHENRLAGFQASLGDKPLPGGQRGAGKRRGLVVAEMRGRMHQPVLIEAHIFRQHPILVAAKLPDILGLVEVSAKPALPERSEHPVAELGAGDAFADSDDLAHSVGRRDERQREFERIGPPDHLRVAVIERNRPGPDHHFAKARLGSGTFDQRQVVKSELSLNHPGFHHLVPKRAPPQESPLERGADQSRRIPPIPTGPADQKAGSVDANSADC